MRRITVSEVLERFRLSPVWWANFGGLSRWAASRSPPSAQPLLILSHPRSGSTWVGHTLGHSRGALYLKEPVTLSHLRKDPDVPLFELADGGPPPAYEKAARDVALALPSFPPNTVPFPAQWALRDRREKRLVIKEVNPLALQWFVERWNPRVIYLVRHPAGVAASFAAQGWGVGHQGFERRFHPERFSKGEIVPERHSGSVWCELGALQGIVLKLTLEQLRGVADRLVVKYEDLCANPLTGFRELYDFAGLRWDTRVEESILRETTVATHDRTEAYTTIRNSRSMADAWRSDLGPQEIEQVREGYLAYGPAYYAAECW